LYPFQDALAVKISLDLLKGLRSYGYFKFRVSGYPPNFQRPLAAKLCVKPPKVLEVQERARGTLSPCQVWGIFFGFYKTRHILLSNTANCTVLRAVVLTQYRRVTDRRTDGIAVASTALAMRALWRDVKTKLPQGLPLSLLRGSRPKSARASSKQYTQNSPNFIQIRSLPAEL